jgi:hypothetical protein
MGLLSTAGREIKRKQRKKKRKKKVTSVAVGSSSVFSGGCGFPFGYFVQINGERACFNKNSMYLVVGYVFAFFVI